MILSGDHLYRMDYLDFLQVCYYFSNPRFVLYLIFLNIWLTHLLWINSIMLTVMLISRFHVLQSVRGFFNRHLWLKSYFFRSFFISLNCSLNISSKLEWNWILFSRASDYGLVKIDNRGRIVNFAEKPTGAELKSMVRTAQFFCLDMPTSYFPLNLYMCLNSHIVSKMGNCGTRILNSSS